jgi:hypothetical protein
VCCLRYTFIAAKESVHDLVEGAVADDAGGQARLVEPHGDLDDRADLLVREAPGQKLQESQAVSRRELNGDDRLSTYE